MNFALLKDYGAHLAAAVAFLVLISSLYQFFSVRNRDARNREFDTYHGLVRYLYAIPERRDYPVLDSQIAVVFEMPRFRDYHDLSLRILNALIAQNLNGAETSRLVDEAKLAVLSIQQQQSEIWLERVWRWIKN